MPFTVDPITGIINTHGNYNTRIATSYSFDVYVENRGTPPLMAHANVVVNIIDCNENAPVFSTSQYYGLVGELASIGSSVLTVSASDSDLGTNAVAGYSIVSGDTTNSFSINYTTGNLYVSGQFDLRVANSYTLNISAVNYQTWNKLVGFTTVTIIVQDQNIHYPSFDQASYAASILENLSVGSTLLTVSASDSDPGRDGRVLVSIIIVFVFNNILTL